MVETEATHPSKKTVTRSLVPARQKTEYGSPWPQLVSEIHGEAPRSKNGQVRNIDIIDMNH
jgi:hypothetical protein